MYAIKFPDMFSSAQTKLVEGRDANMNNLKALLMSDRWALFGDPAYGCSFKRAIFEQNNRIIQDLMIDEIYNVIKIFMPQLKCPRQNIKISSDGIDLYADILCINRIDGVSDMYSLNMTKREME